ncbi:MAG: hypothetical protein ACRDQ2_00225 [Gaiellales bacterium]
MHPFSYDAGALWRGEVWRRVIEAPLVAAARNEPVPGRVPAASPGGRVSARWLAVRRIRSADHEA